MTTLKILRFLQAASYLAVVSQLLFYLVVLSGALKSVSLENFMELRKIVDVEYGFRFKTMYYVCVILSVSLVIFTVKQPGSLLFITSSIALLCLLIDLGIAINGNIPINQQINTYVMSDISKDWESLRITWLRLMEYRGLVSTTGMLSLLIGIAIEN